ncbi:hypothetical protein [Nitrosopumilus sp.]|uniref:hypothetical protein n=1 Tax=Nitrosopumilus sp. TaxID=2024843 RepID=UPI003D0CD7F8
MAATCRGICETLKISGMPMKSRYQLGYRRCTFCGIFMDTNENRCPCCSMVLRTKPRNKLSKLKNKNLITSKH